MRLLFLILISSSCSIMMGDQSSSAKGKIYKIKFIEDGWSLKKKDKRSDYVYEHADGRILLSNSFCEEFQEEDLDHLAKKTFRGIGDFQSQKEKWSTFHEREAYRLEGKGKVDGVPVGVSLLNTRRNRCYFDFVGINPEKNTASDTAYFDRFLSSVEFE